MIVAITFAAGSGRSMIRVVTFHVTVLHWFAALDVDLVANA
jgi:hypothetical protein